MTESAQRYAALKDEAHIWLAVPRPTDPAARAAGRALLCADERSALDALVIAEDQAAYLAAHVLVRESLSCYASVAPAAWSFARKLNGRPELCGAHGRSGLRCNLSHSRGLVACIITLARDCGIDVERINRIQDALTIAEHFFAPVEIDQFKISSDADRDRTFTALWTIKEATLKATGHALMQPLDSVAFDVQREGAVRLLPGSLLCPDPETWALHLVEPLPGYLLAAAVSCEPGSPVRFVLHNT